ncbi:hypothetical protein [Micromonospora echinaurantiaca]|uniref:hypothetical protein n=1 Tax=Micromonospora echinaurantiaca TaxID=47857 RepID=UPI00342A57AE
MARWDAWFEREHLVVRRRRLLPWRKADVRWIPLATVLDIGSLTAADHARRRANLTVHDPAAPHLTEVIPVRFTPEQWEHAGRFVRQRQAAPTDRPQPGEEASPGRAASPRPPADVPPQSRQRAQPPAALRAHLSAKPAAKPTSTGRPGGASSTPSPRPATASTTPVMRASDGKRPVWLWLQNGQIHASLVAVGGVSPRRLSPTDVAQLLLADPSRAMPAIRTLTGLADSEQARARLRAGIGRTGSSST